MKNESITVIDFISKQCRNDLHYECNGRWKGLGYEIICCCTCNHYKNRQALEQVEEPFSNTNHTVQPLSVQGAASTND